MLRKVLIIDDEADISEVLALRLKTSGYDVVTALNGQEGLKVLEDKKPDLIILDILMPVMDGFEFYKEIKKKPEFCNLPILVLTARGAMKGTFDALDVDGFVSKPYDPQELIAKISEIIEKKAILLSEDAHIIEKISDVLEKMEYRLEVVSDEISMMEKGKQGKYAVIGIHLPFLKEAPATVMERVSKMKYKNPKVFVYCDSKVKGTEDNYNVAIEDIKNEWQRAGVEKFFDARWSERSFDGELKMWLK